MRVLIIEDDQLLRELLARRFRQHGFEVVEAGDGDEGLACFKAQPADLVVTDLLMPNKEGIETIRELKMQSPSTQIIAISGGLRGGGDFLKVAELIGAQASFHKPFNFEDLLEKAKELLGGLPTPATQD